MYVTHLGVLGNTVHTFPLRETSDTISWALETSRAMHEKESSTCCPGLHRSGFGSRQLDCCSQILWSSTCGSTRPLVFPISVLSSMVVLITEKWCCCILYFYCTDGYTHVKAIGAEQNKDYTITDNIPLLQFHSGKLTTNLTILMTGFFSWWY